MYTNQKKWKGRAPSIEAFTQIFGEGSKYVDIFSKMKTHNSYNHSRETQSWACDNLSFKCSRETMRKMRKISELAETNPEAKKIWDAANKNEISISKAYNMLFSKDKDKKQVLISLPLELWGELEKRAWDKFITKSEMVAEALNSYFMCQSDL